MIKIVLGEPEVKLAEYVGRKRYQNARRDGIPDEQIGPQPSEETDINGAGAEIAGAKYFNVYPDLAIDHRPSFDCLHRCGLRIDFKGTKYYNGHLLVKRRQIAKTKGTPDIYCLVVGTLPEYRVAGVMTSEEILQEFRLKDFGHGKGFAASQDELDDPELIQTELLF